MFKMILDVDTGVDDALALIYSCSQKNIDLLAVTTTYGNVTVEMATENTLNILHYIGKEEIPVYQGASHPTYKNEYLPNPISYVVHGDNGVGNVHFPKSPKTIKQPTASQFMIEAARQYGKDLHFVCVGPLNNLLEAIKLDYNAISQVGSITLMAGALTVRGNSTPFSEANIYADPYAAKEVFESGIPLRIIPLDVTWQTLIRKQDIALWQDPTHPKLALIAQMAAYYYENEFKEKDGGGAMHDPLAVAAALNPDIITNWFSCNLTIETEPDRFGRLIGNKDLLNDPIKRISIALNVDQKRFIDSFVNSIYQFVK